MVLFIFIGLVSLCTGQNDRFGVQMLQAGKTGGEEWFMDMQNPAADSRLRVGSTAATLNPDGS
jgi:hypothetical protein